MTCISPGTLAQQISTLKVEDDTTKPFNDYSNWFHKIDYETVKLDAKRIKVSKNPFYLSEGIYTFPCSEGISVELSLAYAKAYKKDPDFHSLAQLYFEKVPATHPSYSYALGEIASILLQQNKLEDALKTVNLSLEKKSDNPLSLRVRADIFRLMGKDHYEAALKDIHKLKTLNKELLFAFSCEAEILFQQKNLDLAFNRVHRALALNKNDFRSHVLRGRIYFLKGEMGKAENDFNIALKIRPDHSITLAYRANVRRIQKQVELALADVEKAIKMKPSNAFTWHCRGVILRDMAKPEKWPEALENMTLAIQLDPDSTSILKSRGQLFRMMGEYQKAICDFQCVIQKNPDDLYAKNQCEELLTLLCNKMELQK